MAQLRKESAYGSGVVIRTYRIVPVGETEFQLLVKEVIYEDEETILYKKDEECLLSGESPKILQTIQNYMEIALLIWGWNVVYLNKNEWQYVFKGNSLEK